MTIRELFREFVFAKRSYEEDYNRDVRLAWHVAALMRQEKLPRLESLLIRRPQKPSTRKEYLAAQRSMLKALSDRYGIPLRKTTLIRDGDVWRAPPSAS